MSTVGTGARSPLVYSMPLPPRANCPEFVTTFFQHVSQSQWVAKTLLAQGDPDTIESLNRRRHDLQSALRTVALAAESLQSGYRFDDDRGASKVAAIGRAVKVIEMEMGTALQLLDW